MRFDKKCPACGSDFVAYSENRHFCSKKCYRPPLFKRLLKKLKVDQSGCWLWVGWRDKNGYGMLGVKEGDRHFQSRRVPRVVFKLFNGEIPNGLCVCHTCDNPACFRPSHLFLGTTADNMQDKTRKGRNNPPVGERSGFAKLTDLKIKEIRKLHAEGKMTQREIAKKFGVGYKAISKIILRQRWKHV